MDGLMTALQLQTPWAHVLYHKHANTGRRDLDCNAHAPWALRLPRNGLMSYYPSGRSAVADLLSEPHLTPTHLS